MPINPILQAERYADASRIVFGLKTDKNGEPLNEYEQAVHVSRDLLKEGHMHVRGRTRSGKTSRAIAPLLRQLITPYPYSNAKGEVLDPNMQDPIFIFDLGGDLSLFNFVKDELCKAKYTDKQGNPLPKRNFRFLSLKEDDDWDYFDPFQIVPGGETDIVRLAQLMIEAFNQDYGMVYGASYYSMKSLSALLRVANHVVEQGEVGTVMNFKDVGRFLNRGKDRDEASIRMAFEFLMKYDQIQSPPPNKPQDKKIDMRRALDNSEVIYFFCPSMGQATTARQVAGLGLYTLLAAAQLRKDSGANQGPEHRHAWVIVDEFQELAGRSFASLLAQSSKFGISLILANQTTTQLETRDVNLAHVVRDNTLAKMYFTVTGKTDFDDLQSFSEEKSQELDTTDKSIQTRMGMEHGATEMLRHRMAPVLERNQILSTSSKSDNCFLILDDGKGHHEPQRIFTDYTIDSQQYQDYRNTPIPPKDTPQLPLNDQLETPQLNTAKLQPAPSPPSQTNSSARNINSTLLQLFHEKQQQEQPDYIKRHYNSLSG